MYEKIFNERDSLIPCDFVYIRHYRSLIHLFSINHLRLIDLFVSVSVSLVILFSLHSLIFVSLPQSRFVLFRKHAIWELLLIFYILECGLVTMIEHYLVVHEILKVLLGERVFLEVEIESTYQLGRWLIIWEMQLLQVRMR